MTSAPSPPVAFVTGGGSGFGLEITRVLLERGYRVAMYSLSPTSLAAAVTSLGRQEDRILALPGDVADAVSLSAAVAKTTALWGPIDLAIANAGLRDPGWLDRFPLDAAKRTMEVNYFGMLHLFDACVPAMIERRKGCFVGIASIAGTRCLPGGAAYGASKAAMQAFLDTARAELRSQGVRVVTVNPWFMHATGSPIARPFSVPLDRAARRVVDGVASGQARIEFPFSISLLWRLVRVLPNPVFDWLFGLRAGTRSGLGQRALSLLGRMRRPRSTGSRTSEN